MTKNMAVFCGSSLGMHPAYAREAKQLGYLLASRDINLVYGGGKAGLMGVIADSVLESGGKVIGVIPEFLNTRERKHENLTQQIEVQTMHQRKTIMYEMSDAAIILPGGFGTLDESFEAITLIQTGKIARFPIVFVGVDYWKGLFEWVEEKMLKAEHNISPDDLNLFRVVDAPEEAVEHIFRFYEKYVLKPNF